MYIPIVVAMAANQNVVGAIEGGPLALLAGFQPIGLGCFPLSKNKNGIATKSEKEILSGGETDVRNVK